MLNKLWNMITKILDSFSFIAWLCILPLVMVVLVIVLILDMVWECITNIGRN